MSGLHSQQGYSAVVCQVCDCLSLQCLVPWVNHLPPVCRSIFVKLVLNELVCKLDKTENFSLLHKYVLNVNIGLYYQVYITVLLSMSQKSLMT